MVVGMVDGEAICMTIVTTTSIQDVLSFLHDDGDSVDDSFHVTGLTADLLATQEANRNLITTAHCRTGVLGDRVVVNLYHRPHRSFPHHVAAATTTLQ